MRALSAAHVFRRVLLSAAAVTLVCSVAGCATSDNLAQQYRSGSDKGYIAGDGSVSEYAPDQRGNPVVFEGTLSDGRTVSSHTYAGRVLVVNFWYAGCPPCRLEAPQLEKLYTKYAAQGVSFLGVNLFDSASTVQSFEQDKGITYPSILDRDTGSVLLAFSTSVPPKSTPTTLVIDRKGRVAARILGALPGPGILDSFISDVLAEK